MANLEQLQNEISRLRAAIKQEADYCYGWAANAEMMGDDDRAKRHKERGDRLMQSLADELIQTDSHAPPVVASPRAQSADGIVDALLMGAL